MKSIIEVFSVVAVCMVLNLIYPFAKPGVLHFFELCLHLSFGRIVDCFLGGRATIERLLDFLIVLIKPILTFAYILAQLSECSVLHHIKVCS